MSMQVATSRDFLTPSKSSWWSQRTPLEQKLLLAVLGTSLIGLVLLVTATVFGIKTLYGPPGIYIADDPGVCRTKVCLETVKLLKIYMDENVDPCDDFYNFSCGSFMKNTNIPKSGLIEATSSDYSSQQLQIHIQEILSKNLLEEDIFNATNSALRMYRTCIKQDEISGLEFLRQILLYYFSGWPIAEKDWSSSNFVWYQSLAKLMREIDQNYLFNLDYHPDAQLDTSKYHFSIMYNPTKNLFGTGADRYRELPLSPTISKTPEEKREAIKQVVCKINPNCDENSNLNEDIDGIIQTSEEIKRLKSTYIQEPSTRYPDVLMHFNANYENDLSEYWNTIENLNDKIPEIDWGVFFGMIFNGTDLDVNNNFTITAVVDNLYPIIRYMDRATKRSVANYFGWKLMSFWGQLFSPSIEKLLNPTITRERNCQIFVVNAMEYAVANLYLEKYVTRETLDETRQMMRDVNMAFGEMLKYNEWMDKSTKDSALKKLNNMVGSIASPDVSFNATQLNHYYLQISNLGTFNFQEAFKESRNLLFKNQVKIFREPVDRINSWKEKSLGSNAYYYPLTNAMYYTVGILEPPFYKFSRPRASNLGSFGFVSGHEITHGFDSSGRNFDDSGKLVNWWTNQSAEYFQHQADCFAEQYSGVVEPMTGLKLDGKKTLGEDIADNGGVRAAFLAYKNITQQQGGRLHGLKYSEDQLFFISLATSWCMKTNAETMKYKIANDNHSPHMYRVLLPLKNFPTFAKTFSCPIGSEMNPLKKCVIW